MEKPNTANELIQEHQEGSMEAGRQGSLLGKIAQGCALTRPTRREKSLAMAGLVRDSALIRR